MVVRTQGCTLVYWVNFWRLVFKSNKIDTDQNFYKSLYKLDFLHLSHKTFSGKKKGKCWLSPKTPQASGCAKKTSKTLHRTIFWKREMVLSFPFSHTQNSMWNTKQFMTRRGVQFLANTISAHGEAVPGPPRPPPPPLGMK